MRVLVVFLLMGCIVQAQTPAVNMTQKPLDAKSIAVYKAFVSGYLQGEVSPKLNLAKVTVSFAPDEGDFAGCMKDFAPSKALMESHSLGEAFAGSKQVRLVDPFNHLLQDPEKGMKSGQSVDEAVKRGLAAGLMTFSEILFDSTGTHAAFNYSFHCGSLCGNGGTIVFDLHGGKWARSKRSCGTWIS